MDHRRFLAHPEAHRPFAGGDLFARIGGRAAIDTLVDGLYDGIEVDAVLTAFASPTSQRHGPESGGASPVLSTSKRFAQSDRRPNSDHAGGKATSEEAAGQASSVVSAPWREGIGRSRNDRSGDDLANNDGNRGGSDRDKVPSWKANRRGTANCRTPTSVQPRPPL